jgi:hypothetical protein
MVRRLSGPAAPGASHVLYQKVTLP